MKQFDKNYFNLFIFLLCISIITSIKYPIFKNIKDSETGNIKTILIKTKEQYLNYILNYKYIIILTSFQIYEQEPQIISVFDKLSTYKILNNWVFLKIQCFESNDLCNILSLNISNKSLPSLKIYIKSNLFTTSETFLNFDISDFLEYLVKLSTESIIDIKENNISGFYNKYGKISPVVYYDKTNTEFISCINLLSKKKYFEYFYFGIYPLNIDKKDGLYHDKEKIIFDNYNLPIKFTWEGECDDVEIFLEKNKYPLINNVDKLLIHHLSINPKILVILIANITSNEQIKKFINNDFKKISYMNRNLVFGIVDNNEDNFFIDKYSNYLVKTKNDNDMRLIFYDFSDDIYYIHPILYTLNSSNEKIIYEKMSELINNISYLSFTSGSIIKDTLRKTGLNKIIKDKKQMIALCSTIIIIILGFLYLFSYGKKK